MVGCFRRQHGFSLIELLVVIAIIAIGAAVSVPVLKNFAARYHLRGAARDVASVLQSVRLEAIKRKVNCTMIFGQPVDGTTYDYVAFVDTDKDWSYDTSETILARVNYAEAISLGDGGVTFANNGDGKPAVAFNSRGFPRRYGGGAAGGTVNLKNDIGSAKKVIVASSGRVRIE